MNPELIVCPLCGASVRRFGVEIQACEQCGGTIRLPPWDGSGRLGGLLWRRLRPHRRSIVIGLAIMAAAVAAGFIYTFFSHTDGSGYGDQAAAAAILAAVSTILLALVGRRLLAIAVAILGGAALIAKPLLFPMMTSSDSAVPLGLTSETHLDFLVPGGLLLVLAVIVVLTLQVGRSSRLRM